MIKRIVTVLLGLSLLGSSALARADGTPGKFDYWVLSLSWIPEFCKIEPGDKQCKVPVNGFFVHGLWPQYESGYPSYCGERSRVPKDLVERMAPIMPSRDLVQYEWNKHGTCSGLSQEDYFMLVERARRAIAIPDVYHAPTEYVTDAAFNVKKALIDLNPGFDDQSMVLQCRGRFLREARFCFDQDLQPRSCGHDVEDRCRDDITVRPGRNIPE